MKAILSKITLNGYKSFVELKAFEPNQINVLIGANGSGKSNFISFFRMLSWMMGGNEGRLKEFVGTFGPASKLLHGGPKVSPAIRAEIEIATDHGKNEYIFTLGYAADDALAFQEEMFRFSASNRSGPNKWYQLGAGHSESRLHDSNHLQSNMKTMNTIRGLLRGLVVHQFHDTSFLSRIRGKWPANDGRYLKEDGANLAAFLLRLQESGDQDERNAFSRIESTIKRIAPFIASLVLEPTGDFVGLQWREHGSDVVFSASQASDGFLRALALVALLCQPSSTLPPVLFLDEPELGLHPFGIQILTALIQQAARCAQVFVATQSPLLLDAFEPEDIVIVDRGPGGSRFCRKTSDELAVWRDEYSLGEIWRKNILGGGPVR